MKQQRWLPGELVQATDRVEAELDRPWPLARMAEVAGYSPFHFHRVFRDAVGETPVAFVERLPALAVRVRRRIGEDEAFVLGAGGVGLTLDWPGITEPGWVRQDVGFMVCSGGNGRGDAAQALPADLKGTATESPSGDKEPAVERVIGDGLHATLCAPAEEPVPATTYQRLYVWAMAGRYRLRPGAVLEMRRDDDVLVCLPVRDMEEV